MPQPNPTLCSELAAEASQLRALARRLVADADADDLAQDAMVAALSQRSRPAKLRPWLHQVLRNAQRARVRAAVRRRSREARSADDAALVEAPVDLAHAEILGALRDALGDLEEPYRAALTARFFEDRTAADIARSEGCPAATVRWRVQEGIRRTRRKLDERFDGRHPWLGAMVAVVGVPTVPPSAAASGAPVMMTKLAVLKALTATAAVAATITVVATSSVDVTASPTPDAAPAERDAGTLAATAAPTPSPFVVPRAFDDREAEFGREPDATAADSDLAPKRDTGMPGLAAVAQACTMDEDEMPPGAYVQLGLQLAAEGDHSIVRDVQVQAIEGLPDLDRDTVQRCLDARAPGIPWDVEAPPEGEVELTMRIVGTDDVGNGLPSTPESAAAEGHVDDPMTAIASLGLPRRGGAHPKVSVVVCGDYDCPYCDRARETVDRILDDYGDDVAVHWMHNPLAFHPGAEPAARAAAAAGRQGQFWAMHEALFDDTTVRDHDPLVALATSLGLDAARFAADLDDPALAEAVQVERRTCLGNGARGTPSFFINGDLVVGAQTFEKFAAIIDDELAD